MTSAGPCRGRTAVRAAVLAVGVLASACGPPAGIEITREEYGSQWPFTVDRGHLACDPPAAVIFTADGATYGLNGSAFQRGYTPVEPIWRTDPANPGQKANIGPILRRGLEMCGVG